MTIAVQQPVAAPLEVSFPGFYPTKIIGWRKIQEQKIENLAFTGKGILINGHVSGPGDYVAEVELIIDGQVAERAKLPVGYLERPQRTSLHVRHSERGAHGDPSNGSIRRRVQDDHRQHHYLRGCPAKK